MKAAATIFAAILLLVVGSELAVRASGVVDVPLYRPDAAYGYIPKARQSGVFRNSNRWAYNAQGMGVAEDFRPGGVLLIGDSLVNGGNQIDQPQRLGPQVSGLIRHPVWPVSAGSWSLLNELAWLRANPDIVRGSDRIVFVLGSGDFVEPSVWRERPDLPPHKPKSAAYYLAERLMVKQAYVPPPVTGRDWKAEFTALRRSTNKPVLVVLYSASGEAPERVGRYAADLEPDVLRVGLDPRWRAATFRDLTHVDAGGTRVLAELIAERLTDRSPASPDR